ncbi:MAG: hypothetical protein ACR2M0_01105 [Chloroflexia bacterium]
MTWITIRRLPWTLLIIAGFWPALVSERVQAAPSATISSCSITPLSGGPGTLVHAELNQWLGSGGPVAVGFAVPKTPAELQGRAFAHNDPSSLKPLDRPLAFLPATNNGQAATTFKLPARLSSGQPIPTQNLYLVCLVAGQVDMGEGWGSLAFTFHPDSLPATGQPLLGLWLTLMFSGGVFAIAGGYLVRRGAGGSRPGTQSAAAVRPRAA